jgi:hypothetical protein
MKALLKSHLPLTLGGAYRALPDTLLNGDRLVELYDDRAIVENERGARRYYRRRPAETQPFVLAWEPSERTGESMRATPL